VNAAPLDVQVGPAMALVQIISEHPVRPDTRWTVATDRLEGHVYGPLAGGSQAVGWYAELLGCSPVERHVYEYDGRSLRVLELRALWRDVLVVVEVSVEERQALAPTAVVAGDGTVVTAAELAVAS
jgi:hypothetical protein